MHRFLSVLLTTLLLCSTLTSSVSELRGTWVAWAGTNVPSTDQIVTIMEKLAEANFNMVYVDVWRYGYPYFISDVFNKYARYYTDPSIHNFQQPERDVLAEMIVEAHRVGMQVEAWFEAGFNGAGNTSSPLYQMKPEWFAKKKDGSTAYYGQAGPAMIHCHPEVQQFLIDLAQEVVQKYDVDGIQMDRIRYPSRDCGYDTLTVNLYKQEHGGSAPPDDINDPEWVQWRADKLTEFIGRFYDSLKATNPDVIISNATIPWGPMDFCQNWSAWANQGYLDIVIPMLYYNTNSYFTYQLENNSELVQVNDFESIYPGVTTDANGNYTDPAQLEAMIYTTRDKGLHGNVHWYHANLIWHSNDYLTHLKQTVYAQPAAIPYRPADWRQPAIIIDDTSANVVKTNGWNAYSGSIPLYNGRCLYTDAGNSGTCTYYFNIEKAGWYELYVFINTQVNASTNSKYTVIAGGTNQDYWVDQTIRGNAGRWAKLTDLWLEAEQNQKVLTLTANSGDGNFVFADAAMLLNTNRPPQYITTLDESDNEFLNGVGANQFELDQNYPNPFNATTFIRFRIAKKQHYQLAIFDTKGKLVKTLFNQDMAPGHYHLPVDMNDVASGVYFYTLSSPARQLSQKMVLIK